MSDRSQPTELARHVTGSLTGGHVGRYRIPLGLLAVAVLVRPVVGHPFLLGYEQIANSMLIWMLFAASFNILLGYTGLLSFGHAMFLGIGAYGAAIGIVHFGLPWLISAAIGIGVAAVVANLIARLIVQKGEIYFAMLTLAFAQSVSFIANQNYGGITGGTTGLTGALPNWIDSVRGMKYVVVGGLEFHWYYFLAAVFFLATLAIWQLVRSPFGRTLVVIRENETLARAIGIDTTRYKIWSFTFSGLFAAVAGVLLGINNQGATLSNLSVHTSGDVILMTVLGGANYFFGPIAGVFVWLFSEDFLTEFETLALPLSEFSVVQLELTSVLSYWQFFLGLLFVITVLIAPHEGLWGLFRNGVQSVYDRFRR